MSKERQEECFHSKLEIHWCSDSSSSSSSSGSSSGIGNDGSSDTSSSSSSDGIQAKREAESVGIFYME